MLSKSTPELRARNAAAHRKWRRKDVRRYLYREAKRRARKADPPIPFTIELEDMPEVPEVCPITKEVLTPLGHPNYRRNTAPTLDRIIPALGYSQRNLAIVSFRGNRIKSDGTSEEHLAVVVMMRPHEAALELAKAA